MDWARREVLTTKGGKVNQVRGERGRGERESRESENVKLGKEGGEQ